MTARVLSFVMAALILTAGAWAVVRLGPRPNKPASVPQAKATEPVVPSEINRTASSHVTSAVSNIQHLETFGLSKFKVNSGRFAGKVEAFVQKLEQTYAARGYEKFDYLSDTDNSKSFESLKSKRFFWTSITPGFAIISAVGMDAAPDSTSEGKPDDMFLTVVSNGTGASADWATYRMSQSVTASGDDNGSPAEFPGEDPAFVPRMPGSVRLFSMSGLASPGTRRIAIYKSKKTVEQVSDWYHQNMVPTWRFDDFSTKQASDLADHILCFTQQDRFCVVWVAKNPDDGTTTIVVSVRQD